MTFKARRITLNVNINTQTRLLGTYRKLGDSYKCYTSYDDYYKQLRDTNLKNDIDEYYRLSCINLLVQGYDILC